MLHCDGFTRLREPSLTQVLAAAASNVAVDNLTERLGAALPLGTVVRVGHVARVLPQVTGLSCMSVDAGIL